MNQPVEQEAAVEPGEVRVVADLVGQFVLAGAFGVGRRASASGRRSR